MVDVGLYPFAFSHTKHLADSLTESVTSHSGHCARPARNLEIDFKRSLTSINGRRLSTDRK